MPKITYIEHSGAEHTVELQEGDSLMQGAVDNCVPGIDGDCGGACACATCHIFIPAEWQEKLQGQEINPMEQGMLDITDDVEPNSRLGCQIEVTGEMDGMVVNMPAGQH